MKRICHFEKKLDKMRCEVIDIIKNALSKNRYIALPENFIDADYDGFEPCFYNLELENVCAIKLGEYDIIEFIYDNDLCEEDIAISTDDLITFAKIILYFNE